MGKLKKINTDCNWGFEKTVTLNSFQSLSLLFINLNITLGIHICLLRCHIQVISSLTLSSIARKGE